MQNKGLDAGLKRCVHLLVAMLRGDMQGSAADRAVQGCEAPLHVQSKPRQQQLVHDLVVAVAGGQVAGGHALGVIAGHIAACYHQLGHHIQMAPLCRVMQRCSAHTNTRHCTVGTFLTWHPCNA